MTPSSSPSDLKLAMILRASKGNVRGYEIKGFISICVESVVLS